MANFERERSIEARQIRIRLEEIKSTFYALRLPIGPIQCRITGTGRGPERAPRRGWKPFEMHGRWGGLDQTWWFRMRAVIPPEMAGQPVVALIRPGGQSVAYLNGEPAVGLDPNHDMITLTHRAKAGATFTIATESTVSTRYDQYDHFAYADLAVPQALPLAFWWDCSVVADILDQLAPDYTPRLHLLELLNRAVRTVDLQHKGQPAYFASLEKAQRILKKGLIDFQTSYGVGRLGVIGQSHLDTAWLWPLRETWRKCGRTFSNALDLLDRYPDFLFMATQPVQYEMTKRYFPELFERIRAYVKKRRWEPMGGMWVEPDCHIPSGESLVRQLLYGNRFFREEFGIHTRTAWLPDTFGEAWSLPQILKKAQIETFATVKINGKHFTEFPYGLFQWEGPDGSRVMGFVPPLAYNGFAEISEFPAKWAAFKQKDKVDEIPYTIGYGDGGGGPSMEMVERVNRLANIVGIPRCTFRFMQDTLDRMRAQCKMDDLPIWNGELYVEFHRGCQTSQARTKRNNRTCEFLLHEAEFLSSLALLLGRAYDQAGLNETWKEVLTNQFHDILPGSSIHEVYTQADLDYADIIRRITSIRDQARAFLIRQVNTQVDGIPVIVFNNLSWERSAVVSAQADLPPGHLLVTDAAGHELPHQRLDDRTLLFQTTPVPAYGYALHTIAARPDPVGPVPAGVVVSSKGMENAFIRIRLDDRGRLTRIYDKIARREVLAKGRRGNVLQLFDDRPADSSAWDIDHNFEETQWEPGPAASIEVLEAGPLRGRIRITHHIEESTLIQDIVLHTDSPRLDFRTRADWQHRQTLLKVAFPVEVRSPRATYEIPFATIERATHRNTEFDRARFEVPAHKWADLSEGDYGVSLLNDCKYGYDVKENVLRLALLRSPIYPDPLARPGCA